MTATESEGFVEAQSRLHFGLLDLAGHFGRRYGGAGLMINGHPTVVTFRSGRSPIAIAASQKFSESDLGQMLAFVGRLGREVGVQLRGELYVSERPPSHRGYGSKTALLLAVGEAALRANGIQPDVQLLARLSGRGGASGIGVHGYSRGGLLLDLGRPAGTSLGPSSLGRIGELPLLAARCSFPTDWLIAVLDDREIDVLGQKDEVALFQLGANGVEREEAAEAISAAHHQVYAGAATSHFNLFRAGVKSMRSTSFKRIEISRQQTSVGELIDVLNRNDGVASSMSSVGPLVFAICPGSDQDAIAHIRGVAAKNNVQLQWCRADNRGSINGHDRRC